MGAPHRARGLSSEACDRRLRTHREVLDYLKYKLEDAAGDDEALFKVFVVQGVDPYLTGARGRVNEFPPARIYPHVGNARSAGSAEEHEVTRLELGSTDFLSERSLAPGGSG